MITTEQIRYAARIGVNAARFEGEVNHEKAIKQAVKHAYCFNKSLTKEEEEKIKEEVCFLIGY